MKWTNFSTEVPGRRDKIIPEPLFAGWIYLCLPLRRVHQLVSTKEISIYWKRTRLAESLKHIGISFVQCSHYISELEKQFHISLRIQKFYKVWMCLVPKIFKLSIWNVENSISNNNKFYKPMLCSWQFSNIIFQKYVNNNYSRELKKLQNTMY